MEYYDSINNAQLHYYYSTRNACLLSNDEVLSLISSDQSYGSLYEQTALPQNKNSTQEGKISLSIPEIKENIFKQNSLALERSSNINSDVLPELWKNIYNKTMGSKNIKRKESIATIFYNAKKKENEMKAKQTTQEEIKKFNDSSNKIDTLINNEIINQIADFEKRKKEKKEKKLKKHDSLKIDNFNNVNKRPSKIDDMLISYRKLYIYILVTNYKEEDIQIEDNDLLKSIMDLRENKIKTDHILMTKEIEDYMDKSIKQMHKALEELKFSFDEEIKNIDGIKIVIYFSRSLP